MIRELSEGRSSELSVFGSLWTLLKPSLNTDGAQSEFSWGGGETSCQTLLLILVNISFKLETGWSCFAYFFGDSIFVCDF